MTTGDQPLLIAFTQQLLEAEINSTLGEVGSWYLGTISTQKNRGKETRKASRRGGEAISWRARRG